MPKHVHESEMQDFDLALVHMMKDHNVHACVVVVPTDEGFYITGFARDDSKFRDFIAGFQAWLNVLDICPKCGVPHSSLTEGHEKRRLN